MFLNVTQTLFMGFLTSVEIFALTLLFSMPIGLILALGCISKWKPLRYLLNFIIWVIRGTPLMLQLIVIFYGPGLWLGHNIWSGDEAGRITATVVAFSINYACYFSVIFRGGIEGVPVGQREAGLVLGMTKSQIFFKITLLQMVKRVVPPMSNEIITLVKDTSLAFAIAQAEMFTMAKQIAASQTSVMPLMLAGVFYYVFNLIVATIMEKIEKAFAYYR